MALHAQQQILNALQAALAAGGTVAGARVFLDRVDPLQPAELPAILIEEGNSGESAETLMLDAQQRRITEPSVNCVLAATTTAPADCRAFGLAVEKVITADTALRSLCQLGIQITSSHTDIQGDADRLIATRQQSWRFQYRVHPLNPDIINP